MNGSQVIYLRLALPAAVILIASLGFACTKNEVPAVNTTSVVRQTPAPVASPTQPPPIKDGNYPGKGTVTKIDLTAGSVEMNHEKVEGLMPAMIMEFYVTDKGALKGLTVGEKVDFVIEYNGGRETISSISKSK